MKNEIFTVCKYRHTEVVLLTQICVTLTACAFKKYMLNLLTTIAMKPIKEGYTEI